MAENKIIGYKKIFGFVLPDWIDEKLFANIMYLIAGSLIMYFVLFFFVNPYQDKIKSLKTEYAAAKKKFDLLSESKASLDEIGQSMTPLQQEAIFKAMPKFYAPEQSISSFRAIANKDNVRIMSYDLPQGVLFEEGKNQISGASKVADTSYGVSNNDKVVSFSTFSVKVNVSGQVEDIVNFIQDVQESLPFASVSDMDIQELTVLSGKKIDQKEVSLDLKVSYYVPDMKSYDLTNLKRFSTDDKKIIEELSSFSSYSPATSFIETSLPSTPAAGLNENLFGM